MPDRSSLKAKPKASPRTEKPGNTNIEVGPHPAKMTVCGWELEMAPYVGVRNWYGSRGDWRMSLTQTCGEYERVDPHPAWRVTISYSGVLAGHGLGTKLGPISVETETPNIVQAVRAALVTAAYVWANERVPGVTYPEKGMFVG